MDTISAFSFVANSEKLKNELVKSASGDGKEFPAGDAADLLLTVVTELGIGKVAVRICQFVYALFGWLINIFREKSSASEELPEELEAIVKDAKGVALVDGKPRNREKLLLHKHLLALSAGWKGGTACVWSVMRAIRKLPKDKLMQLSATTFGELTDELNATLNLSLTGSGKISRNQSIKNVTLKAFNGTLKKHAKDA